MKPSNATVKSGFIAYNFEVKIAPLDISAKIDMKIETG